MSKLEEWRDVVGYEGIYQVSNSGRVKRIAPGPGTRPERILKPVGNQRYRSVGLSRDGQQRKHDIHRLVCIAFHGPPPTPHHEVNHKNGIKTDNRASNLEWVTRSENQKHSFCVLGTKAPELKGEMHGRAKLTAKQVRRIRRLCAQGCTYAELGQQFGVDLTTICKIAKRKTWTHI